MKYLLNSAVITAPGCYDYHLVDREEACAFVTNRQWISTIRYAETAAALAELIGQPVPVNDRNIIMEAGDEALVFRLVLPPGRRIDPRTKGKLGHEFILAHCEMGILRRRWGY